MTTPQAPQYLPNMGQPAGKPRPGSIGHLCPDPNSAVEVKLIEWLPTDSHGTLLPKGDRHLAIGWLVGARAGTAVWVLLHLLQERGFQHLTNWGPMTKMETEMTRTARKYSLGTYPLQTRTLLKEVARNTPVQVPDGIYGCQEWVSHVLGRAVAQGVLPQEAVATAWTSYRQTP